MVAISSIRFLFLTQIPIHEITHHADKATGCHVVLDAYKHNVAAVSILSCVVYMHVLPILQMIHINYGIWLRNLIGPK